MSLCGHRSPLLLCLRTTQLLENGAAGFLTLYTPKSRALRAFGYCTTTRSGGAWRSRWLDQESGRNGRGALRDNPYLEANGMLFQSVSGKTSCQHDVSTSLFATLHYFIFVSAVLGYTHKVIALIVILKPVQVPLS